MPTLQYDFVYDDEVLIEQNIWIKDIKHLPDIFFSSSWAFFEDMKVSTYRPMQHIILMLEYYFFGLKPWGYHLINILLHTGNTLLVFCLASFIFKTRQMTNNKKDRAQLSCGCFATAPAFLAALFFAAHPINSQAVAWIGTVVELFMTSLYLLSFYLYIVSLPAPLKETTKKTGDKIDVVRVSASIETDTSTELILSVVFFTLAIFLKEQALTLLFLIILYDYSKQGSALSVVQGYRRYIPYLLVVIGYMALRFYVLGGLSAKEKALMGFDQLILNAFPLFVQYIQKLILPVDLKLLYQFHPVRSLLEWKVIGAMIFTLAFIFFMIIAKARNRVVFLGLSFIAIPLLPVYYMPAIRNNVFSEHYLYLPSFGFALLISYAFVKISEGLWKKDFDSKKTNPVRISHGVNRWLMIFSILIVVIYSFATIKRHAVWKNNFTLWSDALKKSADMAVPHYALGIILEKQGKIEEAIDYYYRALQLKPGYGDAHLNLGIILTKQGKIEEAINHFFRTLQNQPNNWKAYLNLGGILAKQGKLEEAANYLSRALQIKPNDGEVYNSMGVVLSKQGKLVEAIEYYSRALEIKPNNWKTYLNLGDVLTIQGKLEEAVDYYSRVLQIKPDYWKAYNNMGSVLVKQGKLVEAIEYYSRALEIKPNYAQAHNNIGITLYKQGKFEKAAAHFSKALQIKPGYVSAQNNLEIVLQRQN